MALSSHWALAKGAFQGIWPDAYLHLLILSATFFYLKNGNILPQAPHWIVCRAIHEKLSKMSSATRTGSGVMLNAQTHHLMNRDLSGIQMPDSS